MSVVSSVFSSRSSSWGINARAASIMDSIFAIGFGLGLRFVVDVVSRHDFKLTGTLVGLWEGVVMLHFVKKMPSSFDPYVAYGVRLFIDFLVTESVSRMVLVLVWTGLGMVLADVTPAVWVDVGLNRIWRRFRRDLYLMTESIPKVAFFPRARTVRFISSRAPSEVSDDASVTTFTAVPTTEVTPLTPISPPTTKESRKRHVPGSFQSEYSETDTEMGSVFGLRRPSFSETSTRALGTAHYRLSTMPRRRVSDELTSTSTSPSISQNDLDEANLSDSDSVASSSNTIDPSYVNPAEIPDEVFEKGKKPEDAGDNTPKQNPIYMPLTPSSQIPEFALDDPVPPPSAMPIIPDSFDADAGGFSDWENVTREEATTDKPPTPPPKDYPTPKPTSPAPLPHPVPPLLEPIVPTILPITQLLVVPAANSSNESINRALYGDDAPPAQPLAPEVTSTENLLDLTSPPAYEGPYGENSTKVEPSAQDSHAPVSNVQNTVEANLTEATTIAGAPLNETLPEDTTSVNKHSETGPTATVEAAETVKPDPTTSEIYDNNATNNATHENDTVADRATVEADLNKTINTDTDATLKAEADLIALAPENPDETQRENAAQSVEPPVEQVQAQLQDQQERILAPPPPPESVTTAASEAQADVGDRVHSAILLHAQMADLRATLKELQRQKDSVITDGEAGAQLAADKGIEIQRIEKTLAKMMKKAKRRYENSCDDSEYTQNIDLESTEAAKVENAINNAVELLLKPDADSLNFEIFSGKKNLGKNQKFHITQTLESYKFPYTQPRDNLRLYVVDIPATQFSGWLSAYRQEYSKED